LLIVLEEDGMGQCQIYTRGGGASPHKQRRRRRGLEQCAGGGRGRGIKCCERGRRGEGRAMTETKIG